jgi:2-dehydropantoate 2-reductase
MNMKVLIMGAGALGSVFGGFLSRDNEVTLVGRNPHMAEISKKGLRVSGIWGDRLFNPAALTSTEGLEEQDIIFITTKAYDTEEATKQVLPLLHKGSIVVSMQNGIGNEETISKLVGKDRALGGMAIFGALLVEPGHVRVTVYASECLVGALDGDRGKAEKVAGLISKAGIPASTSDDIIREKWMKGFYNMALNPLSAILKVPYGYLGEREETKDIMKEILKEAFSVADKENVNLQYSWKEYFDYLLEKQIPPTAEHKSSMLQDIERGKKTEIDYLNGVVVRLGRKHDIPTPVNETIVNIIKVLEERRS